MEHQDGPTDTRTTGRVTEPAGRYVGSSQAEVRTALAEFERAVDVPRRDPAVGDRPDGHQDNGNERRPNCVSGGTTGPCGGQAGRQATDADVRAAVHAVERGGTRPAKTDETTTPSKVKPSRTRAPAPRTGSPTLGSVAAVLLSCFVIVSMTWAAPLGAAVGQPVVSELVEGDGDAGDDWLDGGLNPGVGPAHNRTEPATTPSGTPTASAGQPGTSRSRHASGAPTDRPVTDRSTPADDEQHEAAPGSSPAPPTDTASRIADGPRLSRPAGDNSSTGPNEREDNETEAPSRPGTDGPRSTPTEWPRSERQTPPQAADEHPDDPESVSGIDAVPERQPRSTDEAPTQTPGGTGQPDRTPAPGADRSSRIRSPPEAGEDSASDVEDVDGTPVAEADVHPPEATVRPGTDSGGQSDV